MAVQWIKFEHTTPDKPEIVAIGAALRVDHDTVVGKLLRIWVWADQNSVDGGAMRITEAFIDRLVSRKGFAAAMRKEKWLAGVDGALVFPNFGRHNGATAKKRSVENRAKSEWRDRTEAGQNTGQKPDKVPENVRLSSGQSPPGNYGPDEDEEGRPKGLPCAEPAPPVVARAKLFEALAQAEGSVVAQLTKPAKKRIEAALRQLLAVNPELQPDEIARRAKRYPDVMPANTKITAHALAMHWAKCEVRAQARPDPEPERWRERLEALYPGNVINANGRPWSQLDRGVWQAVLDSEAKKP